MHIMLQLMATAPVSDMNRRARDVLAMLEDGPVALLQRSEPAIFRNNDESAAAKAQSRAQAE